MTLIELIKKTNFDDSLIFGYYGGGNFGDELLLLTLLNLFKKNNVKNIHYIYRSKTLFKLLNIENNYTPITNNYNLLKQLLKSRNIIVGGGGHWGVDMNISVLLMSILLFISKFILRKNVYLLGVGYYNSTSALGNFSAYLSAKASKVILARDNETFNNFKKFSNNTYLDKDIVFNLNHIDLNNFDIKKIEKLNIDKKKKYILITLRRFQKHIPNKYNELILEAIKSNKKANFILMTMEPSTVDIENYRYIQSIQEKYSNVLISDFSFNPLSFAHWLKLNNKNVTVIAPQYHMQMVAHLLGIKHMPISYDNKVTELLRDFEFKEKEIIKINDLELIDVNNFIIAN